MAGAPVNPVPLYARLLRLTRNIKVRMPLLLHEEVRCLMEILEASDASLGYDAKKFSYRHPNVSLDAPLSQGRWKGDVETIPINRKSAALRA